VTDWLAEINRRTLAVLVHSWSTLTCRRGDPSATETSLSY